MMILDKVPRLLCRVVSTKSTCEVSKRITQFGKFQTGKDSNPRFHAPLIVWKAEFWSFGVYRFYKKVTVNCKHIDYTFQKLFYKSLGLYNIWAKTNYFFLKQPLIRMQFHFRNPLLQITYFFCIFLF